MSNISKKKLDKYEEYILEKFEQGELTTSKNNDSDCCSWIASSALPPRKNVTASPFSRRSVATVAIQERKGMLV